MWVSGEELMAKASERIMPVRTLLDIGCGIQPQQILKPLIHICCEPFKQYVEKLQEITGRIHDRDYIILNASWADAVEMFPEKSVDTVILLDVIEHLEKEEALKLLHRTEKIARRQIAIFTPLGFMPQVHADGKDAWGLDGGAFQEHKSGWQPDDFDNTWEIIAAKQFHTIDSLNRTLDTPFGALWAIKTYPGTGTILAGTSRRQRLHAFVDRIYIRICYCKDRLLTLYGKRK